MTINLQRRPLTDALLAALQVDGIVVGDGVIPSGGGWDGPANAPSSSFAPYGVLTSLTAGRSSGSIGDSQSEWVMPYMIQGFGGARAQCEWVCDQLRDAAGTLREQILALGEFSYKVQQVRTESIGGCNRNDSVDPPAWGEQDQITVWLTKRRNP